jgi:hypothetical protein
VTKADFLRRVDHYVAVFAAHEPESLRGREAADDLAALCNALGLSANAAVDLATRIGTVARNLREAEMYALAADLVLQ